MIKAVVGEIDTERKTERGKGGEGGGRGRREGGKGGGRELIAEFNF